MSGCFCSIATSSFLLRGIELRNPHQDTVDLVTKYNEDQGLPFLYKKLDFGNLIGKAVQFFLGCVWFQTSVFACAGGCFCIARYEMQTALANPWSGDTRDQDILKELDGALQFIHDAKTGDERHHVLVNCAQGVSRSASVTIAYLMKSPGAQVWNTNRGVSEGHKA